MAAEIVEEIVDEEATGPDHVIEGDLGPDLTIGGEGKRFQAAQKPLFQF